MATNMPLRPPMPMDDMHRTMPFDMDRDPRDPRIMSAPIDACRMGMDGSDYFGAMGMGMGMGMGMTPSHHRFPDSPYLPPGSDSDMVGVGMGIYSDQHADEQVRSTNLLVQVVNSQITHNARYSQIQPKMCSDGRFPQFPREFRVPKTVEEIMTMDSSSIDRILHSYGLPTDLRSFRLTSQDYVKSGVAKQAKLCTLLDFLGATQLTAYLRQKLRRHARYGR
ncbi:hypothetical protein EJ04DRAFT_222016 [Polyplosphaeria fusca]|uniref:Uncharacterized protein n=1 Tax=Polyplosphaeria fusca TaxID=682080 RepID=A0A9P4QW58_9PLEO|nr:hypothetical protein EJ04DRAFT_222016 [Polyplosphaeria fusca]